MSRWNRSPEPGVVIEVANLHKNYLKKKLKIVKGKKFKIFLLK
jgi:hypothetical protein